MSSKRNKTKTKKPNVCLV